MRKLQDAMQRVTIHVITYFHSVLNFFFYINIIEYEFDYKFPACVLFHN